VRITVVTLFPDFFTGPLRTGLVGRAIDRGEVTVDFIDPRRFTEDVHRTVDGPPFGGGGGMVMRIEPLAASIRAARQAGPGPVLLLTPQGRPMTHRRALEWSRANHLTFVCGRYEGFDDRVRDLVDDEVSVGDFVVTGGEVGAAALIDAVVRLGPGTLGNPCSPEQDSFSPALAGLLEYPQYTKPAQWEGRGVPDVLRSGDHAAVAGWRRQQSILRTRRRRPELLQRVRLAPDDLRAPYLAPRGESRRGLWLAPDRWSGDDLGHALALAAAYELERVFVSPDHEGAARLRERIAALPPHRTPAPFREGASRRSPPGPEHRVEARSCMEVVEVTAGVPPTVQAFVGEAGWWGRAAPPGEMVASTAAEPEAGPAAGPWLVAVGARVPDQLPALPPLRQLSPGHHLPLPLVAALLLDRLTTER
jgi:tRNA (guanine37-N1)-methyltransferase